MVERRRSVIAIALVLATAAAVVALGTGGAMSDPTAVFATVHGTRPTHLDTHTVTRIGRAFGVRGEPERTPGGWEVEDPARELYIYRTPSAWYALYTNSSALLHPLGDRTTICARDEPPPGCADPTVQFVVDAAGEAPTPKSAVRAARRVLGRAGLVDDRWQAVVLRPSPDVVPCRPELRTELDCTQQYIPTRAVMLTLDLGPGTTDVRWGLVITPDGDVLSATGRIAERRP